MPPRERELRRLRRVNAITGDPLRQSSDVERDIARRVVVCIAFTPLHASPLEKTMTLGTILLIVLVLMLVGALPSWGYSRSWGYRPTGALGIVLIIVLILLLMGRI